MKSIAYWTGDAIGADPVNPGPCRPAVSDDQMRQIFRVLADGYDGKFGPMAIRRGETKDKRDNRARRVLAQWAEVFRASGLTEQELRLGATRCLAEVRVGEKVTPADIIHRARIRPEDIGAPPAHVAMRECASRAHLDQAARTWSHPVIEAAFYSIPRWDWRHMETGALLNIFEHVYTITVRRAALGEDLQASVPKAITAAAAKAIDDSPAWSSARTQLAEELPERDFNTWVRPVAGHEEGDRLVLYAPNRYVLTWLQDHIDRIRECLAEASDRALTVSMVIA